MSFNLISLLDFITYFFFQIFRYLFSLPIRSYNIVCPRIIFSFPNKILHTFNICSCNHFCNSYNSSNFIRNSNFIYIYERIWAYNSSSTIINPFSSKIVPYSSFFSLYSLRNCFQWLSRSMSCRRYSSYCIIKESCYMILQ